MYDNNGNIFKRREFVFTLKDATLIEELESTDKVYIYNGDQMVSYNGQACVYDVMGNPTTYRGKTATWVNGRRLASFDGHTFTYDGQGRRLTKDSVVFAYDSNGRLIKQGDNMEFIYDQTGVVGLKYSGTTYLYRKDAQNNVLALINESGVIVARYLYDAWGNVSVVDNNGTLISDSNHIGNVNPFRYRTYYYDTETKLYFLKTRYYDPEIGRFVTIDGIEYLNPETINGLNLYTYCGNNPVMCVDENGNAWWHWLVGVVVVAALVAATIFTAGGAGAGLMAVGFAAQGMVMAGASTATTVLAFATVGAGVALAASAVVAGIGAIETWSTGGSFSAGIESISDYGATALGSTIGAGIFGGLGGYLSYNQQKITHSWTKERSDYWKNSYNNPNSYGYRQERVLKGLSPIIDGKPVQLHHTMGRVGANFYHYIEMPYLQHIQYHQIYGYKGFSYKTANINIWQILMSLM